MQVGRTWMVFSLTLVLLAACTDKAQPGYAACILAETSGDLAGALKACGEAVAADPTSSSGKAATAKLTELKAKADKMKADTDAKAQAKVPADAPVQAKEGSSICSNIDALNLEAFIACTPTPEAEAEAKAAGHDCQISLESLVKKVLKKMVSKSLTAEIRLQVNDEMEHQGLTLQGAVSKIREQGAAPGEEAVKTSFIADSEMVIAAYKRWASLTMDYDGSSGTDAVVKAEATTTQNLMDDLRVKNIQRMGKCFALNKKAGAGSSALGADARDGADGHRPILPPEDSGFVDTHKGTGWGNKCFANIKAKKWGYAKAECDKAIWMGPTTPMPMAAILFNQGLIAQGMGETERARAYFSSSLGLREQPAVRAALDSLPPQ